VRRGFASDHCDPSEKSKGRRAEIFPLIVYERYSYKKVSSEPVRNLEEREEKKSVTEPGRRKKNRFSFQGAQLLLKLSYVYAIVFWGRKHSGQDVGAYVFSFRHGVCASDSGVHPTFHELHSQPYEQME
jgi:hypothetical protein